MMLRRTCLLLAQLGRRGRRQSSAAHWLSADLPRSLLPQGWI